MNPQKLQREFEDAVERINNHEEPFPADFILRLYAYYKIAHQNFEEPGSRKPLINAFKANALFQAKDLSIEEAKEAYILLVKEYFEK